MSSPADNGKALAPLGRAGGPHEELLRRGGAYTALHPGQVALRAAGSDA
ncbi:hypothetical protein ABZ920_13700 [Streptomyces sp. NPDC046831]